MQPSAIYMYIIHPSIPPLDDKRHTYILYILYKGLYRVYLHVYIYIHILFHPEMLECGEDAYYYFILSSLSTLSRTTTEVDSSLRV